METTYQQDINSTTPAEVAPAITTGFNPTITPQQVYSAQNIASASTPVQIDYSDPYKMRDYFLNSSDMVASRNAVAEANKNLMTVKQTGRAQQQAIQENPMAMNVIRGAQAVAGQQASLREQAAAESLLAAQSAYDTFANEANAKYAIAQQERAKLQDLILQTGGKAGISYTDDFNTALKKATSYQEKLAKEEEKKIAKKEKDARNQSLKDTALKLGISLQTDKGGTRSASQLEKEITKYYKKQGYTDKQIKDLQIAQAQKNLNKSDKVSYSDADIAVANENYIQGKLDEARKGEDGFIDPEVWKQALKEWKLGGGTQSSFYSKFLGKVENGLRVSGYINPRDI